MFGHNCIFTDDFMLVEIRSTEHTFVSELNETQMKQLQETHPKFEKKILIFTNNLYKLNKQYVLDYIIHSNSTSEQAKIKRRSILKNIIAIKIQEFRAIKRKPKLSELLKILRGKDKDYI